MNVAPQNNGGVVPAYLKLQAAGKLRSRAAAALQRLEECDLCARYCRVNRRQTLEGAVCRTGEQAVVASFGAHHGEEECLRGTQGSGTIFFTRCNLRCVYCQNWNISQSSCGREVGARSLADIMLDLQAQGCHNINLVSPSHVVAQIIAAVDAAARRGLRLPLVYNSGGYDSAEALALLDGIVDIYMPDMKYGCSKIARKYSKVRNYVEVNFAAVKEMHRQVGELVFDARGVAQRGLLVRHLVLPGDLSGTDRILAFLAEEVSPHTYLNLMDQYHPCYRAGEYAEIARPPTAAEYRAVLRTAQARGLTRLDSRPRRYDPGA